MKTMDELFDGSDPDFLPEASQLMPNSYAEELIATTAEAACLIAPILGNDPKKCAAWMLAPNPLLGDLSPANMIRLGRGERLLKFIAQQLAEQDPKLEPVTAQVEVTFTMVGRACDAFLKANPAVRAVGHKEKRAALQAALGGEGKS